MEERNFLIDYPFYNIKDNIELDSTKNIISC